MKNISKVLLAGFMLLAAAGANASIVGSMSIGGSMDATGGSDLSSITDIDLITVVGGGGTDDLSNVAFLTTGTGDALSLTAFTPVTNFVSIEGWNFDLTSLVITDQDIGLLGLAGTGVLSGNGLGSTDAVFSFSTTSMNSYSMTITAVPVPAALWLFGSGLIGLAGMARRKA